MYAHTCLIPGGQRQDCFTINSLVAEYRVGIFCVAKLAIGGGKNSEFKEASRNNGPAIRVVASSEGAWHEWQAFCLS